MDQPTRVFGGPSPLKVAVLGAFPSKNDPGKGVFTADFVRSLRKFCQPVCIYPRWMTARRRSVRRFEYEGIEVFELPFPAVPGNLTWSVGLGARLSAARARRLMGDPDIIHCFGGVSNAQLAAQWMKGTKAKMVVTMIGGDINIHLPLIKDAPGVSGWEDKCSAAVGLSDFLTSATRKLYPRIPILETVYNGIDLQRFQPGPPNNGPITFLFLGGFSPYTKLHPDGPNTKGGLTLVEVWKKIEDMLPSGTKLLIGGPAVNSETAQNAISGLRNKDAVEQLPRIPKEEMPALFHRADVVLLPSMTEGLPTVAMETGASARAMLASRVGGVPEVIQDGVTGRILPPGDVDAWAKAILEAASSRASIDEMGRQARAYMEQKFDMADQAAQYERIYAQVLGR